MADKDKMSVEDILAACRSADGDGSAPSAEASAPIEASAPVDESPPIEEKVSPKPAAPGNGSKNDPKQMSAADILAAARGGAGSSTESKPTSKPAAAKPAASPGSMNVADILAAARGAGGEKPAATPKPASAAKAKPKVAGDKTSPKAPSKAVRTGPMDTSSILAQARGGAKPGPISKAEAAEEAKKAGAGGNAKPTLPPMPEKPAYAMAKPVAAPAEGNRRGFMSMILGSFLAVGFTTLTLTNLLWVLGLARFVFPNILIEPPSKFKVGFPSAFAAGSVETKYKAQFGVWVTNVEFEGQQQLVALKTVCTHLGCTPNWLEAEQKFKCPCHGSGFYKDGINFEGPAPRPLERYSIKIADDGQLEVDKSKTFQQEMGQWKDPACFVLV